MSIRFFKTQADFHKWLESNYENASELWVGLHKKESGKPSISYKEAVDEALCFGWIDGLRKRVDETSYKVRFTPRRKGSVWSRINTNRAEELKRSGLMKPSGLRVYAERDPRKTNLYSFENAPRTLDDVYLKKIQDNKKAHTFFEKLPAHFKRTAVFWIMSAKREETRKRRLQAFIEACAKGVRLGEITGSAKDQ